MLSDFVAWDSGAAHGAAQLGQHAHHEEEQQHVDPNPFLDISPATHWCYASYKRMSELFGGGSDNLVAELDWGRFGIETAAAESTFWFGSAGATTACHYDTYGTNVVS